MGKNNKNNKELVKSVRIRLESTMIKELAKQFDTTTQMVRNACRYISLTEFSDEIRQGAKQLLLQEAGKI